MMLLPSACPSGTYGFNCSQTCNCMNGYCDVVEGCMCEEGWEGTDCNIGEFD